MVKKSNQSKTLKISLTEEIDILRKVVEITNSSLELNHILNDIVKEVTLVTKADSVFIYLFDDKKDNLILMASKTPHKKELGKVNLRAGEGITGWVAQEHKIVSISQNAYADKRFKGFDVLPEDRYEAFLSVPVLHKGDTLSLIHI